MFNCRIINSHSPSEVRTIGPGNRPAARVDVFNGDSIIAEKVIKDTRGRVEEFSLGFYNDEPDRKLEFRVEALGGRELWVEEIKVYPDIDNHYKRFFGMVYHYWGLSAGESGLREEAMGHFRIADKLGYKEAEGLFKMARTYENMGMKGEAIKAYREVLNKIPNHIDSLIALMGLTKEPEHGEKIKSLTPGHEIKQNFGGLIEFIGYSIDKERIRPGEELNISYFWRSFKRLRANYSIFVHFRKDGTTVFQNDHAPYLNMNKWREGGVIREDYTVKVPQNAPAGRYDIIIGVWNPEGSKERLTLRQVKDEGQERNELRIGSIEIIGL